MSYYQSELSNLRQANLGFTPPPVLDDVLNDKAIAGKGALEGVSSMLAGSALHTTLKSLVKSKVLNPEDVEEVAQSAANGDLTGVVNSTAQAAVRALNRNLQGGINRAGAALRDLGARGGDLINESTGAIDAGAEAIQGVREALPDIAPSGARPPPALPAQEEGEEAAARARGVFDRPSELIGEGENLRVGQTAPEGTETIRPAPEAPEAPAIPEVAGEATQGAEDAVKAVSTGEKVVEGLDDAAAASSAADFDPVNIAITGLLGLGGVIGGLFIHTHHVENVAQAPIKAVNYGVQELQG